MEPAIVPSIILRRIVIDELFFYFLIAGVRLPAQVHLCPRLRDVEQVVPLLRRGILNDLDFITWADRTTLRAGDGLLAWGYPGYAGLAKRVFTRHATQ